MGKESCTPCSALALLSISFVIADHFRFVLFVSSLNVVHKCLCVTAIYTWLTLKTILSSLASFFRRGGFKIICLKREILILLLMDR